MNSKLYLGLIIILHTLSCGTTMQNSPQQEPCPDDIACTEDFRAITIGLQNSQEEPYVLESISIRNTTDNEVITINQSEWQTGMPADAGRYVILTDAHQKALENRKVNVYVIGTKDGAEVINEIYLIGADCCHIQHFEGPLTLTIE